ncbi:aspartate 4-decarboxylase [Alicyclobacillus herbarius]|uniref:aspartate 4-decarboxylase n=1 Tax=Alicyclobacillus herbarius TaxID=122960 RepID=UPI000687D19F|nr:aspartate 4-decarboxylase [Alicyclobacillus herbarius]
MVTKTAPEKRTPERADPARRREFERGFTSLSPFELKNELIRLAKDHQKKSTRVLLDAGRGNPNWIHAGARDAFFLLGQFAVAECRRVWNDGQLAGKPRRDGIGQRMQEFLQVHRGVPGASLLREIIRYGCDKLGGDADGYVYELVDGIIGDNYPTPDRMLMYTERLVRAYLVQELCGGNSIGNLHLFAVEGATAAMCYIFESLVANHLLEPGARIAVMVPIFPPYIEIPSLPNYHFDVVEIEANGRAVDGSHTWQYPERELDKLRDPSIQALFVVNPSNPPSVAMDAKSMQYLVETVRRFNPQLMIISDDVYSTFVDGFRSLVAELPRNTLCVYSFSKYFGCTGWRLGVIVLHEDNVFDERIAQLPEAKQKDLEQRYQSLTKDTAHLRFIDRLVADSRQVALNHTAGLSTPQQVQMALFAAAALVDAGNTYKEQTKSICRRRLHLLYEGLELPAPNVPWMADYYTEFDLGEWAAQHYGEAFAQYLKDHYEPIDVLFRLAEQSSVVLLGGGGFHGPTWSVRVSLANLDDQDYAQIGRYLHRALEEYVHEWRMDVSRDDANAQSEQTW